MALIINLCNFYFNRKKVLKFFYEQQVSILDSNHIHHIHLLYIQSYILCQVDKDYSAEFLPMDTQHYNADLLSFLSNTLKSHRENKIFSGHYCTWLYNHHYSQSSLKEVPIKRQYINIRVIKCFIFLIIYIDFSFLRKRNKVPVVS